MIVVSLTQGMSALVDDGDAEIVAAHKWCALICRTGGPYAVAASPRSGAGRRQKMVLMHRLILGAPEGTDVDHKNGDSLDNRRENLRLATRSQNLGNARMRNDNTSGYKGVGWHTQRHKWTADVRCQGRRYRLGLFANIEDAARAYDQKARELFGEFARVNFPEEKQA